ncbi:MAG: hypothetical protein AB7V58_07235 [Solirubrobacterales bacterium]
MNCICGCGTELSRGQIELNLVAGEVAIELVVWDKARALGPSVASGEVTALLALGAPRYQDLLAAIHAGETPAEGELEATREWLEDARAARLRLHDQLPLPKKKIKLSDAEQARIDRRHPERSFSGEPAAEPAAADHLLEALLVVALEDVRAGRPEEAERALRRFLSERS